MILHGVPKWDPTGTTETAAPTLWVDPSDSSTLLNTTGGAITNGATVGTCTSKDATHFAFTQWGTSGRPTWDSTGIHALGTLRSNNQILTTTTNTGWTSLSGSTFLLVTKYNSGTGGAGVSFTMHNSLDAGNPNVSMVQIRCSASYLVGGRRIDTDSFAFVSGDAIPANNICIVGGIFDYTNAKASLFQSGVRGLQQQSFASSGSTAGTNPAMISIAGGFAQDGGAGKLIGTPMDGWVGEILAWNSALTADQLVGPHTYLRLKWGVN